MNLLLFCIFIRIQSPARAATSVAAPKVVTYYSYWHDHTVAGGGVVRDVLNQAYDRIRFDGPYYHFEGFPAGLSKIGNADDNIWINHIKVFLGQIEFHANGGYRNPGSPVVNPPLTDWIYTLGRDITVHKNGTAQIQERDTFTSCDVQAGGSANTCRGMAQYSAHARLASLTAWDSPLTYEPAFGPGLGIAFRYLENATDLTASASETHLGPNWNFNWNAWVEDSPTAALATVDVHVRGGGTEQYGGYISTTGVYDNGDRWGASTLTRVTANSYERVFRDGSKEVYATSNGATVAPRKIFLTEVRDPVGNALTLSYTGSRLDTITDATGKITTLNYVTPPRLSGITDPFGRTALIGYDGSGRVSSITDPVGIVSSFGYSGTSTVMISMTTPYGTSTFNRGTNVFDRWLEMTDTRGAKERVEKRTLTGAGIASQVLRLVTPDVRFSTVDSQGFTALSPALVDGMIPSPAPGARGYDWSLALQFSVTPVANVTNSVGGLFTTMFWDKKAMLGVTGTPSDGTAHKTEWMRDATGLSSTGQVAATTAPLEGRVVYSYGTQSLPDVIGTSKQSTGMTRTLDDGTVQTVAFTTTAGFNMPETQVDPLGRTMKNFYAPNGIDLTEIRNITTGGNDLLAKFGNYVNHLPQTITDAAGQATTIAYNTRGQVEQTTNAKGEVTKFEYFDVATSGTTPLANYGKVKKVTQAFGTALARAVNYTYDSAGRPKTVTDHEGYAVTLDYDAIGDLPLKTLDRVTKVTFPDLTTEESIYDSLGKMNPADLTEVDSPLDVVRRIDRRGRETRYVYDAMRNVTKITDPELRETYFTHCTCGALEGITQVLANGEQHVTEWERDIQKRPTVKKVNLKTGNVITAIPVFKYFYGPKTGRLVGIEDGKGQRTNYEYFADDRLKRVFYTTATGTALSGNPLPVATPEVSYTYDARFGRLETMTDGTGTTTSTYVPIDPLDAVYGDGQLASVGGRVAGDSMTYAYDQLGRLATRTFAGETTTVSGYDALGRVMGTTNPLGAFVPTYEGLSGRVDFVQHSVGSVPGLKVDFAWEAAGERRLTGIANTWGSGNAAVSGFGYGYLINPTTNDPTGQIRQWSQTNSGLAGERTMSLGYDEVDQLKEAVRKEQDGTVLNTWAYSYDRAGNRTGALENGTMVNYEVNTLNQLTGTAASPTFAVKFAGTVNEPSNVTVGGAVAGTNSLSWEKEVVLGVGANSVEIRATETTSIAPGTVAQTRTRHANLTLTAAPARTFTYDLNGSTESDGLRTYEWDAANRLRAVVTAGTPVKRTEFTYDGGNRWVTLVEKEAGAVVGSREVIWEGASIAQLRLKNAAGAETERRTFYGGGEVRTGSAIGGTTLTLMETADHLGSVRELLDSTGTIRARYDYDLYGKRMKVSGDLESDFGFTGHYEHTASALTLAPFRAYDSALGRWTSRDPIEENGGLNLYGYVGGNVAGALDPLGWEPNINLFHPNDPAFEMAAQMKSTTTYTVSAHGTAHSLHGPLGGAIPPWELAEIIKKDPNYKIGSEVKLLSCNTGTKPSSPLFDAYASYLSYYLNADVSAPNNYITYLGTGVAEVTDASDRKVACQVLKKFKPSESRPYPKLRGVSGQSQGEIFRGLFKGEKNPYR